MTAWEAVAGAVVVFLFALLRWRTVQRRQREKQIQAAWRAFDDVIEQERDARRGSQHFS
jgi:hypothetical protein